MMNLHSYAPFEVMLLLSGLTVLAALFQQGGLFLTSYTITICDVISRHITSTLSRDVMSYHDISRTITKKAEKLTVWQGSSSELG